MTEELFREDAYLKSCRAEVVSADDDGIQLNRTIFYPLGGGQPGDTGVLVRGSGEELSIVDTRKDRTTGAHLHIAEKGSELPMPGETVEARIDWERRHRLMRMHSCMHLLCALIPAGVTGGSVRDGSARLDFDLPQPPDRQEIEMALNRLITGDHRMSQRWISDDELDARPELVRTMSVQPPRGAGRVRLVEFEGVDLQPCGGTHVASTGEIGPVVVKKIEKKGKKNRRITIEFASNENR
ncbi:MAG: alanyl-tRNA editing protein [Gammaproteobacteria bacterium]|nr:alanyl-tRNA editing protein [Gammaproteobacteria bacterium]